MQKVRVAQNSFQFGEVSDSLVMRTDTAVYPASAQRVENMVVTAEGSLKKRYGLKHIYDYSLNDSTKEQSHLFPFVFDQNEEYIISVENAKVRCFRLLTDGTVSLVATITQDTNAAALPFDDDYLKEYTTTQRGDVMWICHPLFAPRLLTRTSLTTFQISTYTFDFRLDNTATFQPYSKFQDHSAFLDPTATTGTSITVSVYTETATADDDGICTIQSESVSPFDFTLNGALVSSGTATFTTGREISFTSAANNGANTFTITGTDNDGESITEDVTGPNNSTVYSTKFFKTVTAISSNGAFTNVKVGVTTKAAVTYFDITGSKTGSDYLSSKHIDVVLRYSKNEMEIKSVQSSCQATVDIVDELSTRLSVLNPFRVTAGSSTVEVTMLGHGFKGDGTEEISISGASATGSINTGQLNLSTTFVTGIIDENTFTYTAGGSASSTEDGGGIVTITTHAPRVDWDEQSFSAARGYPASVTFHENRLVYGGTIAEPDVLWFSKIGEYFNFDVGEAADADSINLIAATGDVNEIRYLTSNRDLQVFTASSELYVPTYLNQAITPTNAQIRKQTPFGTEFVKPVEVDGATIFCELNGRIVREYLYTDAEDAYSSVAISTIASHLINTPKYSAVAHSGFGLPDSYAAFTMTNGEMVLFTSNRAERRAAWTRVTTDGTFASVCAIEDRLFANVYDSNGNLQLCEFDTEVGLDFWTNTSASNGAIALDSRQSNYTSLDVIVDVSGVQTSLGSVSVSTLGTINGISSSGSQSKSLTSTALILQSCKFKPDGSKFIVAYGQSANDWFIEEYLLTENWDITTASLGSSITQNTSNLSTVIDLNSIDISSDGTKLFIMDNSPTNGFTIHTITLSTAWDISTATLSSSYEVNVGSSRNERAILFSPNGKKFYVGNTTTDQIDQYDLTTAFDISTESGITASLTTSPLITSIEGFNFSPDGTRLTVCAVNDKTIEEYTSSTPFEINTFTSSTSHYFDQLGLRDMVFGNNDSYIYILSSSNGNSFDRFNTVATSNKFLSIPSYPDLGDYSSVYFGKKYTAKIISNPVDASMGGGPATGTPRGITNIVLDLKNANSVKVNSRKPSMSSDFTGKKEFRSLGYSRDPQVTIEQDDPLTMQVNGIVTELIV